MDNERIASELIKVAKLLVSKRNDTKFVLNLLNDYDMHSVKVLKDLMDAGVVDEKKPLEIHVGRDVLVPIGKAKRKGLYRYEWGIK